MSDQASARRRAETAGRTAETIAALFLAAKGYRILARRVRTPFGEIDIVAQHKDLLVIVEVKARPDLASARHAVTPKQRARIAQAALSWAARRGIGAPRLRFDLIALKPWSWPQHWTGAWRGDDFGRDAW